VTTRYRVGVRCSTGPRCRLADAATVAVSRRPALGPANAVDLLPCNLGIEITWPPAEFTTAGGGTYNVYRSDLPGGGTCADALSRAPLVAGLTDVRWIDAGTLPGVAHAWVVEAQDVQPAGACLPAGPGGHAVAHACTAPVDDVSEADLPEGVGAILRASHDGDRVEMLWPAARRLLSGEHFHLLKAWGQATSAFSRVNPEGDVSSSFAEVDTSEDLQFFDLRVANACEAQSLDEFPPTIDR
jgi:hypothetical protein